MICRIVVVGFAIAWIGALGLFLIGRFGLFGQEADPLSGVFLIPLGFPWIWLIDLAPEAAWPWLGALAPGVNLALIAALCRWLGPARA
ncbi:hypothetical protein M1105_20525 [Limibaculum sp. FT325]|uniref:hypothetical protein n=1 Tax=Thermohalobaculum sediminis TaxID=2939436 RepID=UPI0020BEBCBF|nr:hypothetical protein [Limibaculum sediminis]MCL5779336.1 hypothetical protein [Limibaculum sediminis]